MCIMYFVDTNVIFYKTFVSNVGVFCMGVCGCGRGTLGIGTF